MSFRKLHFWLNLGADGWICTITNQSFVVITTLQHMIDSYQVAPKSGNKCAAAAKSTANKRAKGSAGSGSSKAAAAAAAADDDAPTVHPIANVVGGANADAANASPTDAQLTDIEPADIEWLLSVARARTTALQQAGIPLYDPVVEAQEAKRLGVSGPGSADFDDGDGDSPLLVPTTSTSLESQAQAKLRQRLSSIFLSVSFELAFTQNSGEGIKFNNTTFKNWGPLRQALRSELIATGRAAMQSLPQAILRLSSDDAADPAVISTSTIDDEQISILNIDQLVNCCAKNDIMPDDGDGGQPTDPTTTPPEKQQIDDAIGSLYVNHGSTMKQVVSCEAGRPVRLRPSYLAASTALYDLMAAPSNATPPDITSIVNNLWSALWTVMKPEYFQIAALLSSMDATLAEKRNYTVLKTPLLALSFANNLPSFITTLLQDVQSCMSDGLPVANGVDDELKRILGVMKDDSCLEQLKTINMTILGSDNATDIAIHWESLLHHFKIVTGSNVKRLQGL